MPAGYGRKDAKVTQRKSGMKTRTKYKPKPKAKTGMKTGVGVKNLKRSAIPKKAIMSKIPTRSRKPKIAAVKRTAVSKSPLPRKGKPGTQSGAAARKSVSTPKRKPNVMAVQSQARKAASKPKRSMSGMKKVSKLAAKNRGKGKPWDPFNTDIG